MGRAKIDIVTIEDPKNRKITYAKRRAGLFKKAYELSILTASEVLVITRHPSNSKLSHFSHPKRYSWLNILILWNWKHAHLMKINIYNESSYPFYMPQPFVLHLLIIFSFSFFVYAYILGPRISWLDFLLCPMINKLGIYLLFICYITSFIADIIK